MSNTSPSDTGASDPSANPSLDSHGGDESSYETIEEMKSAFHDTLGVVPDENVADDADLPDDLLIDITGVIFWAADHIDTPLGIDSDDYEPAEEWYLDTGYHGKKIIDEDELRDLYVFVRDGVWTTIDQLMLRRVSAFTGLSETQLIDRAEIDMTNTGKDDAPLRITLDTGVVYICACKAERDELNSI